MRSQDEDNKRQFGPREHFVCRLPIGVDQNSMVPFDEHATDLP